jgi:23S rRNA pseudouridine955/2504/2580 synthase
MKKNIRTIKVKAEEDGMRLDRFLRSYYPGLNQSLLQKALRKGLVRVDGSKVQASTRTIKGQGVGVSSLLLKDMSEAKQRGEVKPKAVDAKWIQSRVIYKDDQIIAIDKPAGMAVQGGSNIKNHIDGMLQALCFEKKEVPRLVHRLDKDTSGVLVLARTRKVAKELGEAFTKKHIHKTYWALTVGVPEYDEGKIDAPLFKPERGKVSVSDEGKKALTHYRVLDKAGKTMAWVELEPKTGRTHQLRVHCLHMGTPILGDGKYGGKTAFIEGLALPKQLHLHARAIEVPLGQDVTRIEAPLSGHMKESLTQLGLHYD